MSEKIGGIRGFLVREFRFECGLTGKQILLAAFMFLIAAYVVWAAYWFGDQGYWAIRWHTHLAFTFLTALTLVFPLLLLGLFLPKNRAENLSRWAAIVVVSFIMAEVALLATGINKTYMERRGGRYQSPYAQNMGNYYNIRQPLDTVFLESPEFKFVRTSNSLGHSDKEWETLKDEGTIRILTLGDSFTEGDGTPADSTYPRLMESILLQQGHKVEVLNAGISGSDPFFGFVNLRDRLLRFQPDIVVQTIYSDDMLFDIPLRGGMERFVKDSILLLRKGPWWEPLIAVSYTVRAVFAILGYDVSRPNGGVSNPWNVSEMARMMLALMGKQDSLSCEKGFLSLWAILPLKHELRDIKHVYPYNETGLADWIGDCGQAAILLPCYEEYLENSNSSAAELFWRQDGHHNSAGYSVMAQCMADEVSGILLGLQTANDSIGQRPDYIVLGQNAVVP